MGYKIKPTIPLSEVLAKREKPKEKKSDPFIVRVKETKQVRKDIARDFLIHIEKHPQMNVTDTYRCLGMGANKGNRIQKELLQEGYIEEHKKGKSKYLRLTEKGRQAIGSGPQKQKGRGSDDHRFYQERIKAYYEGFGYEAFIEKNRYGKAIDILVKKPKGLVAYEVELQNTNHILENVRRDIAVGVKEVVIVTKQELHDTIKQKVEKQFGNDKVSLEIIDRYLD